MTTSIEPSAPEQVQAALSGFVASRLQAPEPSFGEPVRQLADGTDTFVYSFRLDDTRLSPVWTCPLVVRIFKSRDDAVRAGQEAAVQRFASERGYRTPAILASEQDEQHFGLPFSIMERAPGVNLLRAFEHKPLRVMRFVRIMAGAHAELHRLPTDACPLVPDGYLVDRRLAVLGEWVDRYRLSEARPAYAWLTEHRSVVIPEERALCHNDFHPLNLVVDDGAGCMVIDWSRAELGDRLHDVARSHVLMSLAQGGGRDIKQKLLFSVSSFVARRYLKEYGRLLPYDGRRLRYWQVLLTFQSWVETTARMALGGEALGVRDSDAVTYDANIVARIRRGFDARMRDFEHHRGSA